MASVCFDKRLPLATSSTQNQNRSWTELQTQTRTLKSVPKQQAQSAAALAFGEYGVLSDGTRKNINTQRSIWIYRICTMTKTSFCFINKSWATHPPKKLIPKSNFESEKVATMTSQSITQRNRCLGNTRLWKSTSTRNRRITRTMIHRRLPRIVDNHRVVTERTTQTMDALDMVYLLRSNAQREIGEG